MSGMTRAFRETHKSIGKAHIEATQRGHVVWVKTDRRAKAQLTAADEDYAAAAACAVSIDRGRWVGIRKGVSLHIRGRALTVG